MRFRSLLIALLICAQSTLAFAGAWKNCVLRALRTVVNPSHDSAVELELDTMPRVMELLTTDNGKVSGLFGEKPVPEWFRKWAREHFPDYKDAGEIPWEKLPLREQSDLINTMSDKRGLEFFDDRIIHGLRTRERARLTFSEPTVFLGKSYPAGTHEIDVSKFLRPVVEYRGPSDVKAIGGVELHFRGPEASGDLARDARVFQTGLGLEPTHQHLHMVSSIPLESLKKAPDLEAARLGDFVRRANQAAEMVDIVHDGGGIVTVASDEAVFFDNFKPEDLEGVTQYFIKVGKGSAPKIADDFKMGWVGMRGSDKYDQPGLWGLEYRAIHTNSDMLNHQPVLNGLQHTLQTPELGLDPARFDAWFKSRPKLVRAPARVSDAWYNQPWDKLLKNAPTETKEALKHLDVKKLRTLGDKTAREVKMLVHDWSNDSLFFDRPELLKKINAAQARSLERLAAGEDTRVVMRDFLLDSGIYKETLKSIGVSAAIK